MNLRYKLLITVVGHFFTSKSMGAAAAATAVEGAGTVVEEAAISTAVQEPSTPLGVSSKQMFKDKTLTKTPGKRTQEAQANLLSPERIRETLGEEGFSALRTFPWDQLMNPEISFDSPLHKTLIRQLTNACKNQLSPKVSEYLDELNSIRDQMLKVHLERVEEYSEEYFKTLFTHATISFQKKVNGDQLGTKVLINQDGKTITYFVKTHSGGIKTLRGSEAEKVNSRELLTYALLEKLHLGPEVHFFGRDNRHIYIATKDMNVEGVFAEYGHLVDNNIREISGELSDLNYMTLKPDVVESIIQNNAVAQNFVRKITLLDLVERLIRLTDLQTNSGNFGFITLPDKPEKDLRIIDFRVVEEISSQPLCSEDWEMFINGKGFFGDNLDELRTYILQTRKSALRQRLAEDIFRNEIAEWNNIIVDAVKKVKDSILSLQKKSPIEVADLITNLDESARILTENFNFFRRELGLLQ